MEHVYESNIDLRSKDYRWKEKWSNAASDFFNWACKSAGTENVVASVHQQWFQNLIDSINFYSHDGSCFKLSTTLTENLYHGAIHHFNLTCPEGEEQPTLSCVNSWQEWGKLKV